MIAGLRHSIDTYGRVPLAHSLLTPPTRTSWARVPTLPLALSHHAVVCEKDSKFFTPPNCAR
uniref:Uncharacterized protein n=1 Tax=Oryza glumipatula TaxID=40148 RepID=A0A0E0ASL2_9ORYZ